MRKQSELAIKIAEDRATEKNNRDDDEWSLSSQDIKEDGVLANYLGNLQMLYTNFQNFKKPLQASVFTNLINRYFKDNDKRVFERNIKDKDKNIFHYLTYAEFNNELVNLFEKLCQQARELGLENAPLRRELGRGEKPKLTPLEHALARNNIHYAFLIAEQLLSDYSIESLQSVVNRTERSPDFGELTSYNDNCKKLNYLVLRFVLDNFSNYSSNVKDFIVECIVTLINKDKILIADSCKLLQEIHRSKKNSNTGRDYVMPILHKIVLLANFDLARCQSTLRQINPEKISILNKEIIEDNGDICFAIIRQFH